MREGRACHGRGGGRPRTSAPTTRSRLLAGSRPCTLAKTDCGVARYSGRRSHIGLCQNCVCEASAFQRRTPTRRPRQARPSRVAQVGAALPFPSGRPRQARPSRVAHGRARRPRRAVYAKAPAGTPRTRGRPRTSAPTTPSRLLAGSRPCTLAKTDCGVARYSGRRNHIGLCQNCVCEASAFQRRTPTRRPRQARPSRVAHGRARRPRRAVYAKAPTGTPRTRGRPRTSAPTTLHAMSAHMVGRDVPGAPCTRRRPRGRHGHAGGRDKRGPPVSHR